MYVCECRILLFFRGFYCKVVARFCGDSRLIECLNGGGQLARKNYELLDSRTKAKRKKADWQQVF